MNWMIVCLIKFVCLSLIGFSRVTLQEFSNYNETVGQDSNQTLDEPDVEGSGDFSQATEASWISDLNCTGNEAEMGVEEYMLMNPNCTSEAFPPNNATASTDLDTPPSDILFHEPEVTEGSFFANSTAPEEPSDANNTSPAILDNSSACSNLSCVGNMTCYNDVGGDVVCDCASGFVRQPGRRSLSLSCLCPSSKIFIQDRCLEANLVVESQITFHANFTVDLHDQMLIEAALGKQIESLIRDSLKDAYDLHNLTIQVSVADFWNPCIVRVRRFASTDGIVAKFLLKLVADGSIPTMRTLTSLVQQQILMGNSSYGAVFPVQQIQMTAYDYCQHDQHNCDTDTTTCVTSIGAELFGQTVQCQCRPFHVRINPFRCVFQQSLSSNQFNMLQKENSNLWITVYAFIAILSLLFILLMGMLLLLRKRPTMDKDKIQDGRFAQVSLHEYKNQFPRAFLNGTQTSSLSPLDADLDVGTLSTNFPPPPAALLEEAHNSPVNNPNVTTFARRQPTGVASLSPNRSFANTADCGQDRIPSRNSYEMKNVDYAVPQRVNNSMFPVTGDRKPINAFDGARYRSAEGMIFSLEDRPAVHEAIQHHRHSALLNVVANQQPAAKT